MIKANELRIGNFITYKENVVNKDCKGRESVEFTKGKIEEVHGVTDSNYMIKNTVNTKDVELFEGIPITKEWLIKFGAEEYDGQYCRIKLALEELRVKTYIYITDDFKTCSIGSYDNNLNAPTFQAVKYLSYVHQLQNLYFALTGEELTIE